MGDGTARARLEKLLVKEWRSIESAQFERCLAAYRKFKALGLHFDLAPVAFVDSGYPVLGFRQRHEAMCVWLGIPFPGVPELWRPAIERGLLPLDYLDPVRNPPDVDPNTLLGEILVGMGSLTLRQLDRLLRLQKVIRRETGIKVLFGVLGVNQGQITAGEYLHALALQVQLPFHGVEEKSCEAISAAVNTLKRRRRSARSAHCAAHRS
ncbi:MAG: hypothetical protein JXR83_17540 [Deltaproteobacteria bacterium]|nr:hypothetical protein [Deltaproteobacteria bacterium]